MSRHSRKLPSPSTRHLPPPSGGASVSMFRAKGKRITVQDGHRSNGPLRLAFRRPSRAIRPATQLTFECGFRHVEVDYLQQGCQEGCPHRLDKEEKSGPVGDSILHAEQARREERQAAFRRIAQVATLIMESLSQSQLRAFRYISLLCWPRYAIRWC
jgi:hypothetical protein